MEEGSKAHIYNSLGENITNAIMEYGDKVGVDLIIAISEIESSAGFFIKENRQRLVSGSETNQFTIHSED